MRGEEREDPNITKNGSSSARQRNAICMPILREHSAILLTFFKLPFVIKIFVLFMIEWPFYTDFTVS